MGNMSYCRFSNTCGDLRDCWDHIEDDDLSPDEHKARTKLLRTCADILEDFGVDVDRDALNSTIEGLDHDHSNK